MTGDLWHRLAAQVEQLDAEAGRALRSALAGHAAALRVQVAGRAGTGREVVEARVRESLPEASADAIVVGAAVDTPDGPDPVLDADLLVYVVPRRLDPAVVHPADRAALATVDPRRIVLVVSGGAAAAECAVVARATGVAPGQVVAVRAEELLAELIAARAAVARGLRDEELARAAAGIPAAPQVRELVEHTLDVSAGPR
ncbi:hypothetical protein [Rhodococcus sp. B50]|uniref:hypothetical protein n=1 Tax=Rhodococcus sp. B50 TaxID=2682847 RepID=UPI001BD3662F|nr:hypothetical protein [Rhodococcus sp. B50]MBS9375289.1 hypothetical protein [Rhodococcus sp. B50]